MTLDFNEHSLWISTSPVSVSASGTTYYIPADSTFMYIGGSVDFTYSNTYNAATVGIYGETSKSAYFIDSASGSVSDISISAIRVQPRTFNDSTTNMNNISNAKFKEILYNMKNVPQLKQGAYILRMYNNTQKSETGGVAYDIPVYISTYEANINMERPLEMNVSLRLKRRSPVDGINVGTTYYPVVDHE